MKLFIFVVVFCHEYSYQQWKCPRVNHTTIAGISPCHPLSKGDKGKAPMLEVNANKEGLFL